MGANRDRGARSRIREYLALHGPIEDSSGGATAVLKDAVNYEGEAVAFIQLVASMDRAGEIKREIRGKRTYKIVSTAAENAAREATIAKAEPVEDAPVLAGIDIDYTKLARALLREMAQATAASIDGADAGALISERDRLQDERDEFAAKLDEARRQLRTILGGFEDVGGSESAEGEQRAG